MSSDNNQSSGSSSGENKDRRTKRDRKNWRAKRKASARMSVHKENSGSARRKRERPDSARRAARRMKSSAEHQAVNEQHSESKASPAESTQTKRDSGVRKDPRHGSDSSVRIRSASARRGGKQDPAYFRLMKTLLLSCAFILIVSAGLILMKEDPKTDLDKLRLGKAAGNAQNQKNTDTGELKKNSGLDKTQNPQKDTPKAPTVRLLTGKVMNEDGQAIHPANLRALKPQMSFGATSMKTVGSPFPTSSEGVFSVNVPVRAVLLEIRARGYATRILPLEVSGDTTWKDLDIVLVDALVLDGQVLTAESGAPLAGAKVSAESGTWRGETRTNLDGRFEFKDSPAEPIALLVTAKGRVAQVVDANPGMTVSLLEGRIVRGLIQDSQSQPVSNADVVVLGSEHPGVPFHTRSDSSGRFQVKGLDNNEEFLVLARAPGLCTTLSEQWQAPERNDVYVTLVQSGSIQVVGRNLDDVRLLAIMSQPGFDIPEPLVNNSGLLFENLCPGQYELERVSAPNQIQSCQLNIGKAVVLEAPIPGDGSAALEFDPNSEAIEALDNAPPLDVQVLDEGDRGLVGAMVLVDYGLPNIQPQRKQTDNNGRVRFPRLSSRILVVAEAPGKMLRQPIEAGRDLPEATLRMVAPARIDGQILPRVPGRITLVDPIMGQAIRQLRTKPNGAFNIDGLAPGKYILEVECAGFQNIQIKVTLPLPNNKFEVPLLSGGAHHLLPQKGK
jgi:hypothetical protein